MLECTPPSHPGWAPATPQQHADDGCKAVATALAAAAVLTTGWGLLSALTGRHDTAVLPALGAVLAVALTSTRARRSWFPALAGLLGFAVGYLGDIAAVALPLWRNGDGIATIVDHPPGLIRAVIDGHSASDWAFFLAAEATAFAATTARQRVRSTAADRTGNR